VRAGHLTLILLLVLFQPLLCELAKPAIAWAEARSSLVADSTLEDEADRVRGCCGIRWSRTAEVSAPALQDADWLAVAVGVDGVGLQLTSLFPLRQLDPPPRPCPAAGITILLI
jgi:hypothetical protein